MPSHYSILDTILVLFLKTVTSTIEYFYVPRLILLFLPVCGVLANHDYLTLLENP